MAQLAATIAEVSPRIVLPCDDRAVWQLHELHGREPRWRGLIEASLGASRHFPTVRSRSRLMETARSLGLRIPQTQIVTDAAEVRSWFERHPGPGVMKVDGSWGGRGVEFVHTAQEGLAAWRRFRRARSVGAAWKQWLINHDPLAFWCAPEMPGQSVSMQTFIAGEPANTMAACWQGEVLGAVSVKVLCTQGPAGAGTVVRICETEEMTRAAVVLAKELELSGFFGLDYVVEASTGRPYLIELNPRCTQLGHWVLPLQGDLIGMLCSKLGVSAAREHEVPIAGETVALFPQALAWNPDSPHLEQCHHDIPWTEPALVRELMRESWAERRLVARFYHALRGRKRDPVPHLKGFMRLAAASGRPHLLADKRIERVHASELPIAIIGAGPYGLSIAAYLRGRGIPFRIFGEPMESWRRQMPKGMLLKSEGFASNICAPDDEFTLQSYCREAGIRYEHVGEPVRLDTFVAYGLEFQRRYVPALERTYVTSVAPAPGGFALTIGSGERLHSRCVVVAAGITHFSYIPPELGGHPPELVTHSSMHDDPDRYRGRTVAVVGAGASAVDLAALMHEAGVDVRLIARRPSIDFHAPTVEPRSLLSRLRAPRSGLGLGWRSRLCTDAPLLFHAMPASFRVRVVRRHLGPAPGWFIKDRVVGKVPVQLRTTIAGLQAPDGRKPELLLARGASHAEAMAVDHVVAATGYKPVTDRLPFLDGGLRSALRTVDGAPALSRNFESSVPGLYFVGLASANSFGPLARFAFGARFTARRLTRHLTAAFRA